MTTVVIFDSGVGGLSIYKEIIKKCPDHQYVFVSDNEAFPYGTKTEKALIHRVLTVIERVNNQYKPDILVIACNTASTIVLHTLRQRYRFPIVGVVPAIKPAAKQSKTKTIGLLATPGTVKRDYTKELIRQYAADCHVISVGSSKLVEIAEQKISGKAIDLSSIEDEIKPFFLNKEIDVLVLACTHFPLLNKEFQTIINANERSIALIDSGEAIANRVFELTDTIQTANQNRIAVFTKVDINTGSNKHLAQLGFNTFRYLDIVSEGY